MLGLGEIEAGLIVPRIPESGRLRKEDGEFKASLSVILQRKTDRQTDGKRERVRDSRTNSENSY